MGQNCCLDRLNGLFELPTLCIWINHEPSWMLEVLEGQGHRCERGESNPYALRHWILSPARLPVPPLSRGEDILERGGRPRPGGEARPAGQRLNERQRAI